MENRRYITRSIESTSVFVRIKNNNFKFHKNKKNVIRTKSKFDFKN